MKLFAMKLCLMLIVLTNFLGAEDAYWLGTISNKLSEPGNWSTGQTPSVTTSVILDGQSANDLIFDYPATVKSIHILSTFNRSVEVINNLEVYGDFNAAGGSLNLKKSTLIIRGHFLIDQAVNFNEGESTVVIRNKSIYWENINMKVDKLFNFEIELQGHIKLMNDLIVSNELRIKKGYVDEKVLFLKGDFDLGSTSYNGSTLVNICGNKNQIVHSEHTRDIGEMNEVVIDKEDGVLTFIGTIRTKRNFTHLQGEVETLNSEFVFAGGTHISSFGSQFKFYDLYINCAGNFNILGSVEIENDLTIKRWNVLNGNLALHGDLKTQLTGQSNSSGTIEFIGVSDQIIQTEGSLIGHVASLKINKPSDATLYIKDDIAIYGSFELIRGKLNPMSSTVTFYGGSKVVDLKNYFLT